MLSGYWLITCILITCAVASIWLGKLTAVAGVTGIIVGVCIFAGVGYTGIAMLAAFFILGTTATAWGIAEKQRKGLAEPNKGKRTAGQVLANAGIAAILGLLVFIVQQYKDVMVIMIAASFSSAAADTLSSELGNLYGRKFFNILTLKKDTRGLNGVVSLEGTMLGIVGSMFIAFIYSICYGLSHTFLLIVIAGTIGNLCDSLLGATLERKNYLNNNAVNFLNTAVAALFILIVYLFR